MKLQKQPKENAHNEDRGGTKVTIELYTGDKGVEIVISLPVPCYWQGKMLPLTQKFLTDTNGRVVVFLPPSNELVPLTPRKGTEISYMLECLPVGRFSFSVPNVPEWTLGEEVKKNV